MLSVLILGEAGEGALTDALAAGPDWLVLALEDTAGDAKPSLSARDAKLMAESIGQQAGRPQVFMWAPFLDGPNAMESLSFVMGARPDGIMLGGVVGRPSVEQLAARLAVVEAEHGWADGVTRILPCVETAEGALAIRSLAKAGPRLAGLTWNERALRADLGCPPRLPDRPAPCVQLSAMLVLAAAAAKVPAIDTPSFGEDWAQHLTEARRDGFSGKLAVHPGQIARIKSG